MRIHTERGPLQTDPHIAMLNPFWGHATTGVMNRPDFADEYARVGGEIFELADLESADLAVWPVDWKRMRDDPARVAQATEFAERARPKPFVVFYTSDEDDAVPVEDATVFRTTMTRSGRRPGEFALPGFHEDLLEYTDRQLPIRSKPETATVSFCGYVLFEERSPSWSSRARRSASELKRVALERLGRSSSRDVFVRARAIESLLHQRHVKTDFVLRSQGGGGAWSVGDATAIRSWQDARRDYVRNIVDSDYVLCTRGVGNYSFRLYEALSLGRIPVFVDTDCVLPYDFALDWRDYVVWLNRNDVDSIGERVAEFHAELSSDAFVERQRGCRELWERWLSPQGFFANFHRHFDLG